MNGNHPFSIRATLAAFLLAARAVFGAGESNGLLQLFDGTSLHGNLQGISTNTGIAWGFPAADKPIVLKPDNISQIRFENIATTNRSSRPTCRFRFHNGDEILGTLVGINEDVATIQSSFGGQLKSSTETFASLQFSARGFKVLYEGPNGPNEWRSGRNGHAWTYKDGALFATGPDIIGRDFGLTNSSSLEFDLAWTGQFNLTVTVYAQTIDHFDYSTSAYVFYLNPGTVSVQRIQAGAGAMMLGRADVPAMLNKNHARMEIRSNREEGTLSLFVNGELVARWRDSRGFVSKGTGVVFYSQVEAPTLKLSNIKLSEWDGRFEPELPAKGDLTEDIVYLANKDKVQGKVEGFADGKLKVKGRASSLQIPLERVTEVYFAKTKAPAEVASPWTVRAAFPGGEAISFQLEKWNATEVSGKSANFGEVAFHPRAIRFLQFNGERAEVAAERGENEDDWIPGLDE